MALRKSRNENVEEEIHFAVNCIITSVGNYVCWHFRCPSKNHIIALRSEFCSLLRNVCLKGPGWKTLSSLYEWLQKISRPEAMPRMLIRLSPRRLWSSSAPRAASRLSRRDYSDPNPSEKDHLNLKIQTSPLELF